MLNQEELSKLIVSWGYTVIPKQGGIEICAQRRTPMYEFDYWTFLRKFREGEIDTNKLHMLDPWTFTIECE